MAASTLLYLLIELQTLRDEVRRIAEGMHDTTIASMLFEALGEDCAEHSGLVRVSFKE
jgi:hypothetical protein